MSTTRRASSRFVLAPTLRGYPRAWFGSDLLAGLAAGAVVIPQAMAYATIAELPVQSGLYTCIAPMLVYAMLGGSRAMSVSTTSTVATLTATTLVTAGVVAASEDPLPSVAMLCVLVGVILLIARVLGLGSLVELISESTLVGIKVGVGATVAVGQLPKLFGVETEGAEHGFIRALLATIGALPDAHPPTVVLSVVCVTVVVGLGFISRRIPSQLILVVGSILVVAFVLGPDHAGIALVEPAPLGFTAPILPSLEHLAGLAGGALGIAVMVFLESAAVARSLRAADEEPIDPDRELLAAGVQNLAGGFLNAMPSAGGFSQSAINRGAGARSQLAGIVTAGLAILVVLLLGPVLGYLPEAVLAAMVITAVVPLIDVRGLARLWRINRLDFWVAAVTAATGLTAGLLPAVAVGVVLTLGLLLREISRVRLSAEEADGELVVTAESIVYTANVAETMTDVTEFARGAGFPGRVVFALPRQRVVSVTVLEALEGLDRRLADAGSELVVALPPEAVEIARRVRWYRDLEAAGRTR